MLVTVQNTQLTSLPEAGEYPAVLYRIVDVGTHQETYQGKTRPVHKVLLSFVVPSFTVPLGESIVPLILHREYTLSLHELSNLRRDLNAMKGYDFLADEAANKITFDMSKLLGLAVLLHIEHRTGRDNRQKAEIVKYAPYPDDELLPENPLPLSILWLEQFDWPLFNAFNKRLRERIEGSVEFSGFSQAERERGYAMTVESDDTEGDLPF